MRKAITSLLIVFLARTAGATACQITSPLPLPITVSSQTITPQVTTSSSSVEIIKDAQTRREAWVDEFYSLRANPIARLSGAAFVGNTKDPNFWVESDTAAASVTQSSGSVYLITSSTANSAAQYQSARLARYVTGNENTFRTLLKVGDTGTLNNTRNWGAFSATDGFFFQLSGSTLSAVARFASTDTVMPKSSWNSVNAQSFSLDTNYHIYEIKYADADVHFYIDHVIMNTLVPKTQTLSQTFSLPITLQDFNQNGGVSISSMTAAEAFISRTGLLNTESQYFHGTTNATTVLKYGAGRLHTITINQYGLLSNSITIYDNTTNSGSIIGVLTGGSGLSPNTLSYDIPFNAGLTITTTGTWDYTVSYE